MTETLVIEDWRSVKLLTIPEIAAWARVHEKTVYRWIRVGKLPALCFGLRTYRVPEPVVAEYLRSLGWGSLLPPNNGHEDNA